MHRAGIASVCYWETREPTSNGHSWPVSDCRLQPDPQPSLVDPRSVATGRFAVSESAVGADYVEIRGDARSDQEEGPWRLSLFTRTTDIRGTIEGRRGLPKCKVKDGDTRPKKLNLKLTISDCQRCRIS